MTRASLYLWATFLVGLLDVTTDWVFFAVEISSSGFEASYLCQEVEPLRRCSNGTATYTCSGYGSLSDPCRNYPEALPGASNECECYGYYCFTGTLTNDIEVRDVCNLQFDETAQQFAISPLSCTSYGSLDDFVDQPCGYLLADDESASGSNECECYANICQDIEGTARSCRGPTGSQQEDYDLIWGLCLACNLIASSMWFVFWGNRCSGPQAEPKSKRVHLFLLICVLLLEDGPQFGFQILYALIMGTTANSGDSFVVFNFVVTCVSLLLGLGNIAKNIYEVCFRKDKSADSTSSGKMSASNVYGDTGPPETDETASGMNIQHKNNSLQASLLSSGASPRSPSPNNTWDENAYATNTMVLPPGSESLKNEPPTADRLFPVASTNNKQETVFLRDIPPVGDALPGMSETLTDEDDFDEFDQSALSIDHQDSAEC